MKRRYDPTLLDFDNAASRERNAVTSSIESGRRFPCSRPHISPAPRGRRLEFSRRPLSEAGALGSNQVHSTAQRKTRLVHVHWRRASLRLGTDRKRQLGPAAVRERLFQPAVHALCRRSLRTTRSHVRGAQERPELLPDRRPETDRRKEAGFPDGIPGSRDWERSELAQ